MATTTTNYGLTKPAVNDPVDQNLWGAQLNTNMDTIDTELDDLQTQIDSVVLFTHGMIMPYAGSAAPSLWQLCYGQAISRTTYSSLFSAIGTTYGTGDGSTTFNVPDLRGRVIAGQDDMGGTSANRLTNQTGGLDGDTLGATGGSETHTLTEAQLAVHYHLSATRRDSAVDNTYERGATHTVTTFSTVATASDVSSTGDAGSGQAHNNVQPTIILNYIIYAGA
jgi:microcystin-dependent protein